MFRNTITQLVRPAVAQARTSSVSYSFSTSSRYADESSVPDGSSLASERMKKLLLAIPPELEVPLPGKKIIYKTKLKARRPGQKQTSTNSEQTATAPVGQKRKEGDSSPRVVGQAKDAGDRRERTNVKGNGPRLSQVKGQNQAGQSTRSQGDAPRSRPQRQQNEERRTPSTERAPRSNRVELKKLSPPRAMPTHTPASLLRELPSEPKTEADLFGYDSVLTVEARESKREKKQVSGKEARMIAAARLAGDYSHLLSTNGSAEPSSRLQFISQADHTLARNYTVTIRQREDAVKLVKDRLKV